MHTDGQTNISNSDVSSINSGSSSSADVDEPEVDEPIDLQALRAEVTKWQERVPKTRQSAARTHRRAS